MDGGIQQSENRQVKSRTPWWPKRWIYCASKHSDFSSDSVVVGHILTFEEPKNNRRTLVKSKDFGCDASEWIVKIVYGALGLRLMLPLPYLATQQFRKYNFWEEEVLGKLPRKPQQFNFIGGIPSIGIFITNAPVAIYPGMAKKKRRRNKRPLF